MKHLLFYRQSLVTIESDFESSQDLLKAFARKMGFDEQFYYQYDLFSLDDDKDLIDRIPIEADHYYSVFESGVEHEPSTAGRYVLDEIVELSSYVNTKGEVIHIPSECRVTFFGSAVCIQHKDASTESLAKITDLFDDVGIPYLVLNEDVRFLNFRSIYV